MFIQISSHFSEESNSLFFQGKWMDYLSSHNPNIILNEQRINNLFEVSQSVNFLSDFSL